MKNIRLTSVLIFCAFILFFISRPSQDKANHSIRILLDRYPNRQTLDVQFRRLLPLTEEFHYVLKEDPDHERLTLIPPPGDLPTLEFQIVKDEITRALLFLRGDADVLYDSLSIGKTEWLRKKDAGIRIIQAEGLNLSFLGFNHRNPALANPKVRQAIAISLPVKDWVKQKLFNWATEVENPVLSIYQPEVAKKWLDEAGYPAKRGAPRFKLQYFTTPVREGNELAALVREALKDVNIQVDITTLETALFFNRLKKGDFDLFSTAWIRFTPQDPVSIYLEEKGARNYFGFKNPAFQELLESRPDASFDEVKTLVFEQLPLVPLYTWKHGLVISKRVMAPERIAEKMDETFRFLTDLRLK